MKRPDDKPLNLDDLINNPSDDFIFEDWDDPEEIPEVWWARPLNDVPDVDQDPIADNRA